MLLETPMSIHPRCMALGSRYFPLFWLDSSPPILVEGGVSAVVPRALKQMKRLGLAPPTSLVLLHEHNDHVLGAPALKKHLGVEALASAGAREILKKEKVMHLYREADRFFTKVLVERGEGEESPWEEFPPLSSLEDGNLPRSIKVFPTPGHSPGSWALFWEEEGILFASDSLGYYSSTGKHFPLFFQNLNLYLESMETMAHTKPRILVLGHLQFFSGKEKITRVFQRSRDEALKLAERVRKAGEEAREMVFKAIRQDELITFYTRKTIQECARLLVKRSLEA